MTDPKYTADVTIIGAGVIGLAVASQVADGTRGVYILEKNDSFGQETSSRNSQVIHSGIYYPQGSLKAKTCVEGNASLYSICHSHEIGYLRRGKLVVAVDDSEVEQLEALLKRGTENGVQGLTLLAPEEIREMEPNIKAIAALLVPSTGVLDAFSLMRYYLAKARAGGAGIAYKARVVGVERRAGEYQVTVEDVSGRFSFGSRVVVNCAGLNSDKVAELAGIDIANARYRLYPCKGEYFSVSGSKSRLVNRLIYPTPRPKGAGLGIHVTLDLEGKMLLGPSSEYVDEIDYSVDNRHRQLFFESAVKFLPFLEPDDLAPEMAGIRATLQPPDGTFADFVIREETDRGLPGFVNLIGIDSPGLTASPAIARLVAALVDETLGG